MKTLATVAIGIVLLVSGIAIGNYVYLSTTVRAHGDRRSGDQSRKPAAGGQEFISALGGE